MKLLREQGKLDEAIAECLKAVELDPTLSETHGSLGITLYVQGKLGEAIVEFRKAIELDPKAPRPTSAWVSLCRTRESWARRSSNTAGPSSSIRSSPWRTSTWVSLCVSGESWTRRSPNSGRPSRLIRGTPDSTARWVTFCVSRKSWTRRSPNGAWPSRSIRSSARRHCNLGHALRDQGKLDEAIAELRKAVTLDPKSGVCHLNLGLALCDQGKLNEAIAEFRKAIELDPTLVGALNGLSWLLANCPDATTRDPVQAVELARKAVQLAPRQGAHWNTLGVAPTGRATGKRRSRP